MSDAVVFTQIGKWIETEDNGEPMLTCSDCEARIRLQPYSRAVGLLGYDYCPYCGKPKIRPNDIGAAIERLEAEVERGMSNVSI